MDPLMAMLLSSGVNPQGAGDQMMNPAGGQVMPQPAMQNPMNLVGQGGQQQAPGGNSLGQLLQGVKAPEAQAPKFSGGITGSQLPYVAKAEDMISPFLSATGANKAAMLPTLGALLSQAPGGGR